MAAWEDRLDLAVSLGRATVERAENALTEESLIIYDPDVFKDQPQPFGEGKNSIAQPFTRVTAELDQPKIMANAVAAGAVWAFLSEDFTILAAVLEELFKSRGAEIVKGNQLVARAGYDRVQAIVVGRKKPTRPQHR